MFNLKGKVAVVTGGAGHLGSAISEGLAECGATVFICSRNKEKCWNLAQRLSKKAIENGGDTLGLELDVSSLQSINKVLADIHYMCGHIDILVNNAVYTDKGDFAKTLEGTVVQTYNCCMAAIPYMKQGGSIINIASMYGMVSDHPNIYPANFALRSPTAYGVGKAGIIALTRQLALDFRPIRLNCISLGAFPKPSVQENKEFIHNLEELIPLGRIGKPKEVAGAVVFLASDESSYVTGSNLVVDGGWTVW